MAKNATQLLLSLGMETSYPPDRAGERRKKLIDPVRKGDGKDENRMGTGARLRRSVTAGWRLGLRRREDRETGQPFYDQPLDATRCNIKGR
jgi:hypothetical protein